MTNRTRLLFDHKNCELYTYNYTDQYNKETFTFAASYVALFPLILIVPLPFTYLFIFSSVWPT